MSYNDQCRVRDRSDSYDDDRYSQHHYNSSRYSSIDARQSNRSSSTYDRRSEIPCRFGLDCRNLVCPYRHDIPPDPSRDSFDRRATIPCRFGIYCTKPLCPYNHESTMDQIFEVPPSCSASSSQSTRGRSNSSSLGSRFEPPQMHQPPLQLLDTLSQQKQDFSKRFQPPKAKLQQSGIDIDSEQVDSSSHNNLSAVGEEITCDKQCEMLSRQKQDFKKRFQPPTSKTSTYRHVDSSDVGENVTLDKHNEKQRSVVAANISSLPTPVGIPSKQKHDFTELLENFSQSFQLPPNASKSQQSSSDSLPTCMSNADLCDVGKDKTSDKKIVEHGTRAANRNNLAKQPSLSVGISGSTNPENDKCDISLNSKSGDLNMLPKIVIDIDDSKNPTNFESKESIDVSEPSEVKSLTKLSETEQEQQELPQRTDATFVESTNGMHDQSRLNVIPKPKSMQQVNIPSPQEKALVALIAVRPHSKPISAENVRAKSNSTKPDNDKCDASPNSKFRNDVKDKNAAIIESKESRSDGIEPSEVESDKNLSEQELQESPQQSGAILINSTDGITDQSKLTVIPKPRPLQKVNIHLPQEKASGGAIATRPRPKSIDPGTVGESSQPRSTSTLASLLSSQRRSAAQLQRYRIQRARPFENMQNDAPIKSTVPMTSVPSNNTSNESHRARNSIQQDGVISTKNLTNVFRDGVERAPHDEKSDLVNGTRSPRTTQSAAEDIQIGSKKRKVDEMMVTVKAQSDAAAGAKSRRRNKVLNPFRVKVGSIVSVRYRNLSEGGNSEVAQLTNELSSVAENMTQQKRKVFEVWCEPIPGRDEGISLFGCRIKCVFMKSFVEKWLEKNSRFTSDSVRNSVEGNVVSIFGSDPEQSGTGGIVIGLLVDQKRIKYLPFLPVIADDELSSSKLALKKIEDKIKGETNVVVKVTLASIMDKRRGTKLNRSIVKQWVVRKRITTKPSGKKPTKSDRKANSLKKQSLFVGDGNDDPRQQEKNWRWVAGHSVSNKSNTESSPIDVASQIVGEVTAMNVHDDSGSGGSLATVTIRRLWTPEQTKHGRLGAHDDLELFDDHDDETHFQAPVEDLVVIGKGVNRLAEVDQLPQGKNEERKFHVTHSYNASDRTYKPLCGRECNCHLCNQNSIESPECTLAPTSPNNYDNPHTADESISSLIKSIQASAKATNFTVPDNIGLVTIRPSYFPNTSLRSELCGEADPVEDDKKCQPKRKKAKRRKKRVKSVEDESMQLMDDEEDLAKFKPTCSRTIAFDDIKTDYWYLRNKKTTSAGARRDPSTRENARPRSVESKTKEEVTSLLMTGRAARANQRRIVKGLGNASTSVDRLAGRDREQYLRFGKSNIEGWGVFTEEPLNKGELIIEYRGELIGHAVADKREKEYEAANIPDYMFRIDAFTVCDATRLGNVARFINASCSPNCYTQIITANENKRIVIYAKRNIARGEELCYDYKFPIEMDPTKRLPCGCGSIECRGFMNWDKRWD